jgi:hypothetical protein
MGMMQLFSWNSNQAFFYYYYYYLVYIGDTCFKIVLGYCPEMKNTNIRDR